MQELSNSVGIAESTLDRALEGEVAFTIIQLKKLAKYFNRGLLFFINPNDVIEEKVTSPQFRTINRNTPISSPKLRRFIEHVEDHRKKYIGLLEELDIVNKSWYPENINFTTNKKYNAEIIREWLNIPERTSFKELRDLVEAKDIMVIVSNGYNGHWQIDKSEPVRGFSLYYDSYPIIVIRKQSEGAESFTLFHELVHLLLHKQSVMDLEEYYHSTIGIENEANLIAGYILMPDIYLEQLDLGTIKITEISKLDNYLNFFSKQWGISNEAILVRLIQERIIDRNIYAEYKTFKEICYQRSLEALAGEPPAIIPRNFRHREPLNIFGKPFIGAVINAYYGQKITLAKVSSYLDNIKIIDVHKLVNYAVHI